eukprot:RCo033609
MGKRHARIPVHELTLVDLRAKLKRDPSNYRDEFLVQLRHFESCLQMLELRPSERSKELCELLGFIGQVAASFPQDAAHVPGMLVNLLERHLGAIHPAVRKHAILALMTMRSRELVPPDAVLPFFFKLFRLPDKELRKHLVSHIIYDIKRINAKKKDPAANRKLQTFMHKILDEDDSAAALYSLIVMIDLYRRKVWSSNQMVNTIARGCFSKHSKIVIVALRFLLGQYSKVSVHQSENPDEVKQALTDQEVGKKRREIMYNFKKAAKKTGKRRHLMEKALLKVEKARHIKPVEEKVFPAVEVINDPQGFAEKLLGVLQKSHQSFDLRLLVMRVMARLISTHQLQVLSFYPYLERHMEPFHREVASIMEVAVESVHDMIPPDAATPLLMTIANHFVNDKSEPDIITIGLNTIREMCRRQPLLMNDTLLQDLVEYKSYKKDRGVAMAAKGIIHLYRGLQPTMLRKKDRGKFHDSDAMIPAFGSSQTVDRVPGIELLEDYERERAEAAAEAEDTGQPLEEESDEGWIEGEDSDDSSSSDSGDWVDVSSASSASMSEDDEGELPEGEDAKPKPRKSRKPAMGPDGGNDHDDDDKNFPELVNLDDVVTTTKADGAVDSDSSSDSESYGDSPGLSDGGKDPASAVTPPGGQRTASANPPSRGRKPAGPPPRVDAARILTPADFRKIEALSQQRALTSKATSTLKRRKKLEELRAQPLSETLELGTAKSREKAKEERRQKVEKVRERHKARSKKDRKGGGTSHRDKEHAKRFILTRHKFSVRRKTKLSSKQKLKTDKKRQKGLVKFKIRHKL